MTSLEQMNWMSAIALLNYVNRSEVRSVIFGQTCYDGLRWNLAHSVKFISYSFLNACLHGHFSLGFTCQTTVIFGIMRDESLWFNS